MKTSFGRSLIVMLLITFLSISSDSARAFIGPKHRSMTIEVLGHIGFSARAADKIAASNVNVDIKEFTVSASHFDSEAFEAGSQLLKKRLQETVIFLINGNLDSARANFGYITHSAQDFYAHSNYVELIPGQSIDLTNLKNPSKHLPCSRGKFGMGLTSGYYPDNMTPRNKCSHFTLAKDYADFSHMHSLSIYFAEKETAHMFELLKRELLKLIGDKDITAWLLDSFMGKKRVAKKDSFSPYRQVRHGNQITVYDERGQEIANIFLQTQIKK